MAASGISADASQEAFSGWMDVTNLGYRADNGSAGNNNARSDVGGNGGGRGMRVRSSTGAATLDNAMQLSTLGATDVTIAFDINLDDDSAYILALTYSEDAAFTAPVTLAEYLSDGTNNGGFFADSHTITDGIGGINFTDDAYFMIRKIAGPGSSNPHFHTFDNISITAEVADANAVPEPATATLAMLGLGGLMMRRRNA